MNDMNQAENALNDICKDADVAFPGIGLTCDFEDMSVFTVYSGTPLASDGKRVFDTRDLAKGDEAYARGIHMEFVSFCMSYGYIPEYGTGNSSHWVRLIEMKTRETI
jgi:hypothetical protein